MRVTGCRWPRRYSAAADREVEAVAHERLGTFGGGRALARRVASSASSAPRAADIALPTDGAIGAVDGLDRLADLVQR